jgi:hypothetical protein
MTDNSADKPKKKLPDGRCKKYSDEMAKRVCDLVATHTIGLKALRELYPDIPDETNIHDWRWKYDKFHQDYARAKMRQAELMAEKLNEITSVEHFIDSEGVRRVDSGTVALQRLKADTIKWQASKLAPKIYGDVSRVENTVIIKYEDALKELD